MNKTLVGIDVSANPIVGLSEGVEGESSAATSAARNARAVASAPSLYLSLNNSVQGKGKIEKNNKKEKENNNKNNKKDKALVVLTPAQEKTAYALRLNVVALCDVVGLENCGFFTLTFKENLKDWKEAQRRFNNLCSNYIRKNFGHYICVMQLQERGAVHYHLLIDCNRDIRTGFDWDAVNSKDYSTTNKDLKIIWRESGEAAEVHGFGRTEIRPIRTNAEGIGKYLAGYLSKGERTEQIKGARTVRYSKGFRVANNQFTWTDGWSVRWRRLVAEFANHNKISYEDMGLVYGRRWAYYLKKAFELRNVTYPEEISERVAWDLHFMMTERRLRTY